MTFWHMNVLIYLALKIKVVKIGLQGCIMPFSHTRTEIPLKIYG